MIQGLTFWGICEDSCVDAVLRDKIENLPYQHLKFREGNIVENSATPGLTLPVLFGIVKHLHNVHTASRKEHVCCLWNEECHCLQCSHFESIHRRRNPNFFPLSFPPLFPSHNNFPEKMHFFESLISLQPLYGTTHVHNSSGCALDSTTHRCVLFSWCGFLPCCLGRCRECRLGQKNWENVEENIADAFQSNSLLSLCHDWSYVPVYVVTNVTSLRGKRRRRRNHVTSPTSVIVSLSVRHHQSTDRRSPAGDSEL